MALVSYDDLMAPSPTDTSSSVAESSLLRMNSAALPMPPAGARPAPSEIQEFATWLANGAPQGDCGGSDGGIAVDPYGTPTVCTSSTRWNGKEGATMRPGESCISCHLREREGPRFSIAGTVYPTAHEPDSCNGSNARAIVEITDHNGVVHSLTANAVGNFDWEGQIAVPYTAKLMFQGRTRSMASPQTSGDCNTCHTQSGANNAPGRIMLP